MAWAAQTMSGSRSSYNSLRGHKCYIGEILLQPAGTIFPCGVAHYYWEVMPPFYIEPHIIILCKWCFTSYYSHDLHWSVKASTFIFVWVVVPWVLMWHSPVGIPLTVLAINLAIHNDPIQNYEGVTPTYAPQLHADLDRRMSEYECVVWVCGEGVCSVCCISSAKKISYTGQLSAYLIKTELSGMSETACLWSNFTSRPAIRIDESTFIYNYCRRHSTTMADSRWLVWATLSVSQVLRSGRLHSGLGVWDMPRPFKLSFTLAPSARVLLGSAAKNNACGVFWGSDKGVKPWKKGFLWDRCGVEIEFHSMPRSVVK